VGQAGVEAPALRGHLHQPATLEPFEDIGSARRFQQDHAEGLAIGQHVEHRPLMVRQPSQPELHQFHQPGGHRQLTDQPPDAALLLQGPGIEGGKHQLAQVQDVAGAGRGQPVRSSGLYRPTERSDE